MHFTRDTQGRLCLQAHKVYEHHYMETFKHFALLGGLTSILDGFGIWCFGFEIIIMV